MNKSESESKITVSCPSGHRLRGGLEMVGETVSCPKCQSPFVFAPSKPQATGSPAVTDTGVVRILGDMPQPPSRPMRVRVEDRSVTDTRVLRMLGDMPQPPSPPTAAPTDDRAVTDTGVMRILGDMPQPPSPPSPAHRDDRAVTDTGVMRILGDASELPSSPSTATERVTRPCSRCGVPIQESLAVCPHCNCYLGVKPSFLQQMSDNAQNTN